MKGTIVFIRNMTGSTLKSLNFCLHMEWNFYSYPWLPSVLLTFSLMVLRNEFGGLLAYYSCQPNSSRLSKIVYHGVPVSLLDATTVLLRPGCFKKWQSGKNDCFQYSKFSKSFFPAMKEKVLLFILSQKNISFMWKTAILIYKCENQ